MVEPHCFGCIESAPEPGSHLDMWTLFDDGLFVALCPNCAHKPDVVADAKVRAANFDDIMVRDRDALVHVETRSRELVAKRYGDCTPGELRWLAEDAIRHYQDIRRWVIWLAGEPPVGGSAGARGGHLQRVK